MNEIQIGDLVVVEETEFRGAATPVIHTTICEVEFFLEMEDAPDFVMLKPIRHFCYVEGYPELGRRIPAQMVAAPITHVHKVFTV